MRGFASLQSFWSAFLSSPILLFSLCIPPSPLFVFFLILQGENRKRERGRKKRKFGNGVNELSADGRCMYSLDHDLFASTVRINLDGAFYSCQAAARQMALQGRGGSIIAISSISALVGGGQQTHYTPTKAGVLSLMQSMAVALGKYKIRCNALLPGTIRTQLNEEDLADEEKKRYVEGRIPLGRTGEPSDMAGPAVFLACRELSGYVNGAQLLVDGGLFVNLQ